MQSENKIPEYFEIKCDYRVCNSMATKYFQKVAFEVVGEGVIARNVKLCDYHKNKLVKRLGIKDTSNNIPYVVNKSFIQCSKCGKIWKPRLTNIEYVDSPDFMKLPRVCVFCKVWGYRNFAKKRRNLERCLIA